MTTESKKTDAPGLGRLLEPAGKFWALLVDGLAAAGSLLILVLMMIICADILARNAVGASLPLVSELGALLLVMIVALQLATTVRTGRLARTDIFYSGFRRSFPRAGALLSGLFNLTGTAVIGGIAWSSIRILEKDWISGEYIGVTGIATFPTWPFRMLILLGMTIAAIQFFILAIRDFGLAFSTKDRT
ncbi:TRAP transporter small permease subunit [Roseibium marinum]|uniref:TRAP transporter small permease protein n=1 Tax=Roseibium marinum TaxID=281252 RepID=A0A2S3UJW9_9HYPH|nr:TRAP transporter small permease [Roseibium marinum]POF27873.1 TRAP-type mannitol/chloroaromatic compound transport system permease small subunit [Roseibium marinum]